ncbi:hypothetical protein EB118_23700 [bacterium]|nr:hypothetical protein [bacterium]NDG33059.1 hypothetical protein [bacterium]
MDQFLMSKLEITSSGSLVDMLPKPPKTSKKLLVYTQEILDKYTCAHIYPGGLLDAQELVEQYTKYKCKYKPKVECCETRSVV